MEPKVSEQLIIRYLCGDVSREEIAEVNHLKETDESFKKEFEELRFAWERSAMPHFDPEQDWKNICNRIAFCSQRKKVPFSYFVRIAAVITLFLSVSTALWFYWNVPGYGRWVVFETGIESDSIVLPDESIVFLNRNSSLKFRSAFGEENRNVELNGEGYFEITHDKNRPFRVEVGRASVKVLGTAFHLNGIRKDEIIELNVTDGTVEFSNSDKSITVTKGEWAIAGEDILEKGDIKDPNFMSWKTGTLEFNNTSLSDVVKALDDYFVDIENVNIVSGSDVMVTTRFQGQSLSEITEELSVHFQKKITFYKGTLTISD